MHLILLTDRLVDVLPTIRSRCQLVRFDAPPVAEVAAEIEALGVAPDTAIACARLSLGDGERARELARERGRGAARGGRALRARRDRRRGRRAQAVGGAAGGGPQREAMRRAQSSKARAAAELELYPRKERKRVETEWTDRIRRVRRRVETSMLDLGLAARCAVVRRPRLPGMGRG